RATVAEPAGATAELFGAAGADDGGGVAGGSAKRTGGAPAAADSRERPAAAASGNPRTAPGDARPRMRRAARLATDRKLMLMLPVGGHADERRQLLGDRLERERRAGARIVNHGGAALVPGRG